MDLVVGEPWARVRHRDALPRPLSVRYVRELNEPHLAELIRQNILPPDDGDRAAWNRLWAILSLDHDLAERADRILTDFADVSIAARNDHALSETDRRRAGKFAGRCEDALDRMERLQTEPLEWAGAAASGFNKPARAVIAQLVEAIAEHRAAVEHGTDDDGAADYRLWQVLAKVDLDPADKTA